MKFSLRKRQAASTSSDKNSSRNSYGIRKITIISITAVIYTILTLAMPFPQYGQYQFRISEILNLLVFYNPIFAPGIILGCFISNLFSSNGAILDCTFGTLATILTMFFIRKSKNLFIASLWPTVFCIFVGLQLLILSGPPYTLIKLAAFSSTVMAGEFVVMTIVGVPLFKILEKNKGFMNYIKSSKLHLPHKQN